jgi:hypothetical protein
LIGRRISGSICGGGGLGGLGVKVKRTRKYPWYPVLKGQRRRAALIVGPKEQFPQFRNFYAKYGHNPMTDDIETEIVYIQTHMPWNKPDRLRL